VAKLFVYLGGSWRAVYTDETVSELTLDADGAIVPTQHLHTVDTYEDAASDDLTTITNTNGISWVVLHPANDARTVVVKHNTGNIWLQGGQDVTLDDIEDGILLFWDTINSKWFDIAAGGGGGDVTNPLEENLDFDDYEAENVVLHNVADEAARLALSVKAGKMVYQADEGAPYIFA